MGERPVELQAILTEVRRRWKRHSMLRGATIGAGAAALVVLAGSGATWLVARDGLPLLFVAGLVIALAAFALVRALWRERRTPTDRQVARLIEERDGGLDDVLVTAVEYGSRVDASPRMRDALMGDASQALTTRGLDADLDGIISRRSVGRAALRAAAACAALALVAIGFSPSVTRATKVASAYLFPAHLSVEVTPGPAKVPSGTPLTITARIKGFEGEVVPTLHVAAGDRVASARMTPTEEAGTFVVTIDEVTSSFAYHVSAATARSEAYAVTLIRPPHVERIDVHYAFPQGLGLEPRTDEDSGDIYGPLGTRVRLSIAADKPIRSAALVLDDGTRVPLTAQGQALDGDLTIADDGSYRIALADEDGLTNDGDIEYFIRTIEDRPPDVRILRPASDRKVSPLEEVPIEVRADDDFGIASLDLVFQSPNGKERAVPVPGPRGGLTAAGLHMLFMEELKVQPGDFVTYYARARDVARGRRSTEARSDIFFLEVKPFEEEFVAAQTQQGGRGAGMQGGLEGLVEAQKQIIVATWNLDARARRARGAQSAQDIRAVGKSQSELRERAQQASAQTMRTSDPRTRRRLGGPAPGDDPIGKAAEAMGRAAVELEKLSTSAAMPHEMEALNQLLRAEAENRRRQVTRSQQAGGGGGQNRAEADLSSLFDQELRKRQSTNYETPNSTEERSEAKADDPLDRVRELARRQDALNRSQRDLQRNRDQMDAEELKRQLERLTREQNALRQEAQELSQQAQRGQSGGNGQKPGEESRRLREISEDMRNAAAGLQRQDPEQAAKSSSQASDRLRELERQMQSSRPDERRRALGDMQLESRQIAEAQRRLANETSRTDKGQAGADARRRLAGEQDRLAERAQRLQDNVQQLSRAQQGDANERQATGEAARDLERERLSERMRQSADALRQGAGGEAQQQDVAKALDRVADRLGQATGNRNADARRQSDQLAQAQELRDKLQQIDRSVSELKRESEQGEPSGARAGQSPSQSGGQQRAEQQQAGGQQAGGQQTGGQQAGGQQGQSPSQSGRPQQSAGEQAGGGGGNGGGRLEQLQREVNEQMREAERLSAAMERENPGMAGANPEADWWRSFSAPGTEGFKQDFARWETLKKNLLVALEDAETRLSDKLRTSENDQRLNAGGHDTVSEAYRELVEKYYRSLAAPRRPQ